MQGVVDATDDDVARFYRSIQFHGDWTARCIRKGRLVAAMGGVMEIEPGVWFGFIDLPAHLRGPMLYRHTVKVLNEAKAKGARVIRAVCDTDIPRAEAFMRRLGFRPTDEGVWEWEA